MCYHKLSTTFHCIMFVCFAYRNFVITAVTAVFASRLLTGRLASVTKSSLFCTTFSYSNFAVCVGKWLSATKTVLL